MEKNIYTEEELHWCRGGNTGMLPTNITPSQVNVLADGEVFVFGSNFQGAHIGGAARVAKEKYGAAVGSGKWPSSRRPSPTTNVTITNHFCQLYHISAK